MIKNASKYQVSAMQSKSRAQYIWLAIFYSNRNVDTMNFNNEFRCGTAPLVIVSLSQSLSISSQM